MQFLENKYMEDSFQRLGLDRRKQDIAVPVDRRQGSRRLVDSGEVKLTDELIKKIPLFRGFSEEQYRQVYSFCSLTTLVKDSIVCNKGEDALDLYILLKGRLRISIKGILLNVLYPVCIVGEIGVFTDGNRTASVVVDEESTVIRIPKKELLALMQNDIILSNHVLQNVVNDLVGKLQEDNRIIMELRKEKNTFIL
jgi:CRP-like cAMP-binding protein